MSAAMFARMKELEARVKALEQEVALLKEYGGSGPRPTLKLPEKPKAA